MKQPLEAVRSMRMDEIFGWLRVYNVAPFGTHADWTRHAQLRSQLSCINAKRGLPPDRFYDPPIHEEPLTLKEIAQRLREASDGDRS